MSLIEKEKIFQEPELTLQQLATKLNSPAYLVSQTINDELKKKFLWPGKRMQSGRSQTIAAASGQQQLHHSFRGFEAGFNSKLLFNTVFKSLQDWRRPSSE